MALEPITRQEKIIAGQDLTPITRMENFLKNFGVGSIPKPLTYDYMPEGYPSKSVELVTLMEEQEVAFTEVEGIYGAESPVALAIGTEDKLTVLWDGVSYDVVVQEIVVGPSASAVSLVFGNLGLMGEGEATDYPFLYVDQGNSGHRWGTADTASSHTIKVMRQQVTITPMSTDFLPVVDGVIISSSTTDSTKKFKITVNDSGTISATEVT